MDGTGGGGWLPNESRAKSGSAPSGFAALAAKPYKLLRRVPRGIAGAYEYVTFRGRRRLFARLYIRGEGIEIGALSLPLPVSRRARVRYVDRMSVEELLREYPHLKRDTLVPVHIIDDGESLTSQRDESVDFVIANHMIEHAEDPLGTLASFFRVIRPGGVLYLGVPDRRRTFDADREPTPLAHIKRDHEEGPGWSRHTHFEEWARLVLKSPPEQIEERARVLDAEDHSIHFHVWDMHEFREVLAYAQDAVGLSFDVDAVRRNLHEFVVVLRKT